MCSFFCFLPRGSLSHCMPRRPPIQNTAALVEGVAALDQSLKAVNARLRQMRKAEWTQRKHELSARQRLVQLAVVILLLYDTDRCWLPAFMMKHGMSGVDEELSAFDEEVVGHFLALSPEDLTAMRTPTDQQGRSRLKAAQAFITEHRLHAWVARQNEENGMAPTVGDALQHRDELAAADAMKDLQGPMWSVAKSARYKWGAGFRKRWRLGLRKPHAREAVPLEIARRKAVHFKGRVPSQFCYGEMLHNQAKCFALILLTLCQWIFLVAQPTTVGLNMVSPTRFFRVHDQ